MIEMCSTNPLLYFIEFNHPVSTACFLHISLYSQYFYPSVSNQPVMKSFPRSAHGLIRCSEPQGGAWSRQSLQRVCWLASAICGRGQSEGWITRAQYSG